MQKLWLLFCLLASSVSAQTLQLSVPALRGAYVLTRGMDREVGLCGMGSLVGDTTTIRWWLLPDQISDDASVRMKCPSGTLAVYHNHPWQGPSPEFGIEQPEDLCAMSYGDGYALQQQDSTLNWAIVGVGRYDPQWTMLCWWHRSQISAGPFTSADSTQRIRYYIPALK